jgi:ABC-type sugar transport system permease subunit
MQLIYSIVYVGIFVLTVFVLPLVSALYEADYEDSKCKQFCRAFVEAFIISAVWCAVVFISYIFVSKYQDQTGIERQINVPMHMFLCQALLGWVLLAINGALGLVFFPYDLIMGFINRPRKITK